MLYLTNSELLDEQTRQILSGESVVMVSGRPLNVWSSEKEYYYNDCEEIIDMLFVPRLAVVTYIPDVGHRHLDVEFRGEYVTVTGSCPENNNVYRFGIRDELHFSIRAIMKVR